MFIMAFGFKRAKFETSKAYTVEELYEAIKDKEFTAGKPQLAKHGMAPVIVFPPLDSNNQIWVIQSQFKAPYTKWQVYKSEEVGLGNAAINQVASDLTGGATRLSGIIGSKAKAIEKLVEATAKELSEMGL